MCMPGRIFCGYGYVAFVKKYNLPLCCYIFILKTHNRATFQLL
jgi:hypothetical protein